MELEQSFEKNSDFQSLKKTIKGLLGFDPSKYSDSFINRRITSRMRAKNTSTYPEYEKKLKEDKNEQEQLLKNLSIHVTEFFRDRTFWDFCKETLLKESVKRMGNKGKLRVWSAGCSSGQEAISVMIMFLEAGIAKTGVELEVTCTDISEEILDKAKKAEYEMPLEIKGLDERMITTYFDVKKSTITLKAEYRKYFKFLKHDLLLDEPLKDMDIILLRNTVIYFSKEAKEALYVRLYNVLRDNGFFVLGKTETVLGPAREMFKVYDLKERVFEKKV